jgi:hypothetical protein
LDPYEDIRRVLTRRKLGREESLQLVLTCLIVGRVYPQWGTRSTPTVEVSADGVGAGVQPCCGEEFAQLEDQTDDVRWDRGR